MRDAYNCYRCGAPLPTPPADVECEACKEAGVATQIPFEYYAACRTAPPAWLVAIGYPKHGKSTLIRGMLALHEELAELIGAVVSPFEAPTFAAIAAMKERDRTGDPEPSTKGHDVRLLSVRGLPGAADRTLILHDVQGQLFEELTRARSLSALRHVRTVWMVVCPRDLAANKDQSLHRLFLTYVNAMTRLEESPSGRTIVVVYTKADEHTSPPYPPGVKTYWNRCPFQVALRPKDPIAMGPFELSQYLAELARLQPELKAWTKSLPGGASFLKDAEHHGVRLRFAVTSATGRSVGEADKQFKRLDRYRVFDPLFLSLAEDSDLPLPRTQGRPFALIVDNGPEAASALAGGQAAKMFAALQARGEVTTYWLGHRAPLPAGRSSASEPRSRRPRLLGPILEDLPTGVEVVVLAAGPILDLFDFYDTGRRADLFLVRCGGAAPDAWIPSFAWTDGITAEAVLSTFIGEAP